MSSPSLDRVREKTLAAEVGKLRHEDTERGREEEGAPLFTARNASAMASIKDNEWGQGRPLRSYTVIRGSRGGAGRRAFGERGREDQEKDTWAARRRDKRTAIGSA